MEAMPISRFKARCLAVMDRVRRTGRPVRVTRYGQPIADIVPAFSTTTAQRPLGTMADRTIVEGDLVEAVPDD